MLIGVIHPRDIHELFYEPTKGFALIIRDRNGFAVGGRMTMTDLLGAINEVGLILIGTVQIQLPQVGYVQLTEFMHYIKQGAPAR